MDSALSILETFLISKGFTVEKTTMDSSFGNFTKKYKSKFFDMKIVNDKSSTSLLLKSNITGSRWYDYNLINTMLTKDSDLTKSLPFETQVNSFVSKFDVLTTIFSDKECLSTINSLDELQNLRVIQLFPKLKIKDK